MDHNTRLHVPNRRGAQRRPSGNEPRSTKTSRGLRRIRHGSGLQDHHRPTGLRSPVVGFALLGLTKRLEFFAARAVSLGL